MKTITVSEFHGLQGQIVNFSYAKERVQKTQDVCNELIHFVSDAQLLIEMEEIDDNGTLRFGNSEICFERGGIKYVLHKIYNENKYQFYVNLNQFENISNSRKYDIQKKYDKPCNIGVFTQKKVQNWINYCADYYNAIAIEDTQRKKEVDIFLKTIEKEDVKWHRVGECGTISKNGLIFTFQICQGCISQSVDIQYFLKYSYEAFKMLADNKYVAVK